MVWTPRRGASEPLSYKTMNIVIDKNIPFIKGVFEPYASVEYMPGDAITSHEAADAEVLVIRTRTRCDRSLLDGSRVEMIATATIGFDHIDTGYCASRGIAVARAAGCNAYGVVQYVTAALIRTGMVPGSRIAVIGAGSVGGALCRRLQASGFVPMPVDPPRAASEAGSRFYPLEEALEEADAVTLHVPLTKVGPYRTERMADDDFFGMMKKGALFINSSRGEVVDDDALKRALENGTVSQTAIDVWNGEPCIDRELLRLSTIATPHIAGYSLQGKAMGTAMVVRNVAERYGIAELARWWPDGVGTVDHEVEMSWSEICDKMADYYDIERDTRMLKERPDYFERLRNEYEYRREFF